MLTILKLFRHLARWSCLWFRFHWSAITTAICSRRGHREEEGFIGANGNNRAWGNRDSGEFLLDSRAELQTIARAQPNEGEFGRFSLSSFPSSSSSSSFSLSPDTNASARSCFGMPPPPLQQEESDSIPSPWRRRRDSTGKFSRAEEGKARRGESTSPWRERGRGRKCERERAQRCAEGRERRRLHVVVTSQNATACVQRQRRRSASFRELSRWKKEFSNRNAVRQF